MPPNQQQNPYEFINNAGQQPNRFASFVSTTKGRAIVVGTGVVVLIILMIVFVSFLNAGNRAQRDRLIDIALAQHEIIQISDVLLEKSQDSTTQATASTTLLAVTTSQSEVTSALESRGTKVSDKLFAERTDGTLENQLERAADSNRLEETYKEMMRTKLSNYQRLLRAAYDSGNIQENQILQSAFNQAELISKEVE